MITAETAGFITLGAYSAAALWDYTAPWRKEVRAMGPLAYGGLGLIAFSYFVANLYRIVPAPDGLSDADWVAYHVQLFQLGLALLIFATGLAAIRLNVGRPVSASALVVMCAGLLSVAISEHVAEHVETQRYLEFAGYLAIVVLALMCVEAVPRGAWIALVIWLVYAAGEALEAGFYYECNMTETMGDPRGTSSSCGRMFGPLGDWILPIFDILALGYIFWCVFLSKSR